MQYLIIGAVSLLSGLTASLGLGGGFVLVIYLTAIANMQQMEAQGINLVFFIPIAILSLVLHAKNKLLDKRPLLPSILGGILGVGIGFGLSCLIGSAWLSKLFAIFRCRACTSSPQVLCAVCRRVGCRYLSGRKPTL